MMTGFMAWHVLGESRRKPSPPVRLPPCRYESRRRAVAILGPTALRIPRSTHWRSPYPEIRSKNAPIPPVIPAAARLIVASKLPSRSWDTSQRDSIAINARLYHLSSTSNMASRYPLRSRSHAGTELRQELGGAVQVVQADHFHGAVHVAVGNAEHAGGDAVAGQLDCVGVGAARLGHAAQLHGNVP